MLPQTGDLLARKYRLGAPLGRGAMGIVYEARHETLDQPVAIKILRRSDVDDEDKGSEPDADRRGAIRRFEREARIVAKLDSPHVVRVIDVDRTEDGLPYLVMERLEGRDLSAEVEARGEAPIPIAECVGWMVQVCEAMRVAHDAGVVHRDLKLSNVFLTTDGTVKVLDFGVAVFSASDPERSTTTTLAGTPRYMAPEQLLGELPDPSSDIWAIGVMLYRTLGGKFPYDAPTMAAQMLAMMDGCPMLDEVAPRVPRELARIVARALGRTLEERWPSAPALATALVPFALAADASSAPADPARPAPKRGSRPGSMSPSGSPRRRILIGLGVLTLAGVVAIGARYRAAHSRVWDRDDGGGAAPEVVAVVARGPAAERAVAEATASANTDANANTDASASASAATDAGVSGGAGPRAGERMGTGARRPRAEPPPPASRTGTASDGFPPHL